jgi:hypothetical protein
MGSGWLLELQYRLACLHRRRNTISKDVLNDYRSRLSFDVKTNHPHFVF